MVVGFTGTRQGMTAVQTIQLRGFLEVLWDAPQAERVSSRRSCWCRCVSVEIRRPTRLRDSLASVPWCVRNR